MKSLIKHFFFILFIALFCLFCLVGCSKDDATPPIEKLPKATQTGAGTFGCLVNGKAFVHNDGLINCFYQYVDGGYYFSVGGDNKEPQNADIKNIYLQTKRKEIVEGKTYQLLSRKDGNVSGGVGFSYSPVDTDIQFTNSNYTGEITITKFDTIQYIVSGTFWFDIKNPKTNDTIKIRQGRFDSLFY